MFVSNCELANFLAALLAKFDWGKCGRRSDPPQSKSKKKDDDEPEVTKPSQLLFNGNICKLHGDMEHEQRKLNFFKFDKVPEPGTGAVLVCTDVASRGLDFKHVSWILQYDLTSQVKEYVNRVGRTARIAAQGSVMNFVMTEELPWVKHLSKKYKIELTERSRYRIFKEFETGFHGNQLNANLKYKFRKLVNIEDKDEQQESLHAIRQLLTSMMVDLSTGLKSMGQVARSSSTRAYAGHAAEFRHIFDLKQLNLTEYARSFGLYKQLYHMMQADKKQEKRPAKVAGAKDALLAREIKARTEQAAKKNIILKVTDVDLEATVKENQDLFSRRLQKSKIKELERQIRV